jgi:hypothetical protein
VQSNEKGEEMVDEKEENKKKEEIMTEAKPDDAYEISSYYIDKNISNEKLEAILDEDFHGLSIVI